jgi:ectoine hydroxylase-related dioxygenase (phytanoyl-CoA dioxygenase family)
LIEPSVVAGARGELETLVDREAGKLLASGKIRDPLEDEPFETRLFRLYKGCLDDAPDSFRAELHLAGLYGMFFHPKLLDVVETILGGEIRLYPNYTARAKLPDWEGSLVLWHQDGGYTETVSTGEGGLTVDKMRMVNVWTPLVPARIENGCMRFIPGTHKLGVVPHVKKKYYLEIVPEVLDPRLAQAVDIELDPGDVVVFHNLLFHHGQPNRTRKIRWSLDWRYQDASQPTLRRENGHIARSASDPARAVRSAEQWASLSFV